MKKLDSLLIVIIMFLFFVNAEAQVKKLDFPSLTKNYFDDKNALDPLSATQSGQNEYDDQLQFEMTDGFRKKQAVFFDKYKVALTKIDKTKLSEEEKNSYEIIKWEVEIGKELLKYPTNYIPFTQFDGTHLAIGEYAEGTSAQPFETKKDYTNFLKRLDLYSVWIDSSIVFMKKGMAKGIVLPKA